MTRPALDTKRLAINVMRESLETLRADAADKGYQNGNGVLMGDYLGAIARLIQAGKLKVPRKNA